nr:insulin-like growth factor-binding protein 7 [Chrysemys picta bellii]
MSKVRHRQGRLYVFCHPKHGSQAAFRCIPAGGPRSCGFGGVSAGDLPVPWLWRTRCRITAKTAGPADLPQARHRRPHDCRPPRLAAPGTCLLHWCLELPLGTEQGPSIVTPPKETWNVTGAKIYLSCEVMGIPTPVLTWNKIIRGQSGVQRLELLPGDRDNLAIQTRGGPEKHEVTGWVLISPLSKADAGEYECHASNSKGEATASARITVLNDLHEIPLTKDDGAEL